VDGGGVGEDVVLAANCGQVLELCPGFLHVVQVRNWGRLIGVDMGAVVIEAEVYRIIKIGS
jgi:hypothetical protein